MTKQKYNISQARGLPEDARFTKSKRKPKTVEMNERETYPFSKLEVEHSFFVPGKTARDMRGSIHSAKNRYNHRYVARTENQRGIDGVRVWRTQ